MRSNPVLRLVGVVLISANVFGGEADAQLHIDFSSASHIFDQCTATGRSGFCMRVPALTSLDSIETPIRPIIRLPKDHSRHKPKRFNWDAAIRESLVMVAIQNAGNLAMDRWKRYDLVRGPFFRDWFTSVAKYRWSVWNDNDPFLDDYIAHPMQGSLTAFIYVQNDGKYRGIVFSNSHAYWMSRLRALGWATIWSVQWKIGPFSEASIGNTGSFPYYSRNSHGLTNGTGVVDLVMTPVGGIVWATGEDILDRYIVEPLYRRTHNPIVKLGISILNPTRSAANLLRLKPPWFRDSQLRRMVFEDGGR